MPTLEEVQALGYSSIEEAENYQKYLEEKKICEKQSIEAVRKAEREGSNTIDVRHINWPTPP